MDILYLVDRLENLVANSKRMPLVNQIILKESEILTIIDQMRTSIPGEIKQARKIIQEKERILAQAQADATNLLARTREETDRALTREGLLKAAQERSQEIIRRAQEEARTIRREADQHTEQMQNEADAYAAETLRNLRAHLLQVGTEVERTIMSIERGLESLEEPPPEEQQEMNAEESADPERARNSPRRASLAADTMGGPLFPQ